MSDPARALAEPRPRPLWVRVYYSLAKAYREVLHVTLVRYLVASARYLVLAVLLRRRRTLDLDDDAVAQHTVSHNLKGLKDLAVTRSLALIRPLMAIDRIADAPRQARVLCVGPRTEGELLNLVAHGFRANNIRGLDLISYSPWIDLGDMHQMPYDDDRWDVVILGWVMAYSNDPAAAAAEVVRVARPGALVAVGVEYNPASPDEVRERLGYYPGSKERITDVDQILSWFEPHLDTVYYRHDPEPERRDRLGSVVAVFSLVGR